MSDPTGMQPGGMQPGGMQPGGDAGGPVSTVPGGAEGVTVFRTVSFTDITMRSVDATGEVRTVVFSIARAL